MTAHDDARVATAWKRTDEQPPIPNEWLSSEPMFKREHNGTTQYLTRVRIDPTNAYERSGYRLITQTPVSLEFACFETLRDARRSAA